MLKITSFCIKKLSTYWTLGIILIYGLLIGEYLYCFNVKFQIASNMSNWSYLKIYNNISFVLVVVSSFVVWLISSMLLHFFSILFGGNSNYKSLLKSSAVCYIIPAICYIIAIVVSDKIILPSINIQEFLASHKLMIFINWTINIGYIIYFLMLLSLIKYLYKINWLKAIGAIVIPIGSIYLLGLFFANFVL